MKWDKKTLGEIFDLEGGKVQTGPFGSQLHESDYKSFGVPVIMPKDIIDDKLKLDSMAKISVEDANRLSKHLVQTNDIIFPRRGEIDKRVLISDENSGTFCGTGCIRLRGTGSIIDSKFLFYYLKQANIVKWIENQAIGATMMNLNTAILRSVPVKFPKAVEDQKLLASIFSAYDDLNENNHQRRKLLEEMTEQVYKEWFVRFRFPGHKKSIFFNKDGQEVPRNTSEAIPAGWENVKASTFCTFPYGKMPIDKNEIQSIDFPYEIQSGHGIKGYSSHNNIKESRIVITVRGSVGRVEILYNKCWVTNLAVIVKYSKKCDSIHYLFYALKSQKLEWLNTGSAIPQITAGDLGFVKILIPDKDLQKQFEKIVSPMYEEIRTLKRSSNLLKETRDLLLPRLISGKLSVEDLVIEQMNVAAEPQVN